MLPETSFLTFWALTFGTLCAAFLGLMLFYRLADAPLELRSVAAESVIIVLISLAQAVAIRYCAPFMGVGGLLAMAVVMTAVIVWLAHYPDWGGFEAMGLAIFQWILCVAIYLMLGGAFAPACIFLALFAVGLGVIIGFGKSL